MQLLTIMGVVATRLAAMWRAPHWEPLHSTIHEHVGEARWAGIGRARWRVGKYGRSSTRDGTYKDNAMECTSGQRL